ncbi:MAG: PRC-barrel domain-containing protein [Chitinivibrionales bacterium]
MFRSIINMQGMTVFDSAEKDVGSVTDLFFDDNHWIIRYVVADVGGWLRGREVLLATSSVKQMQDQIFSMNISREQIEKSPPVDTNKPVSRQQEHQLHDHYRWPHYWDYQTFDNVYPIPARPIPAAPPQGYMGEHQKEVEKDMQHNYDTHLRSCREVAGYRIHTQNGEIGHIHDFLVDTQNWRIRYLVVKTANLLPGKKTLLSPDWIDGISWASKEVLVNVTRDSIRDAPDWHYTQGLTQEYERNLYAHYDKPGYWQRTKQTT